MSNASNGNKSALINTEDAKPRALHTWQIVPHLEHAQNQRDRSDHCDSQGKMTLHLSAENGHENIVRFLLDSGAETDASDGFGFTALHHAAKNGHTRVVAALLENGADVDATDHQGWTALHLAAKNGYDDIIRLLIQNGANMNAKIEKSFVVI